MIYFIRHGLDDERFVGGWSSNGLIPEGENQVNEAIKYLKKARLEINKIITSDIQRALETALMINEVLKLPLEKTDILRELDKGEFTGIMKDQINIDYPGFLDNLQLETVYPGGESQISFSQRIQSDLDEILKEDEVLLVTHRGVINEIYRIYNGDELNMDKERYDTSHGSIHALDKKLKKIKRIY